MIPPRVRLFVLPLALLALPLLLASAQAQEEGGSIRDAKVREIIVAARGKGSADLGRYSEQLVKLGSSAKRSILRALKEADTPGKLAALRALLELGSPTLAAERLLDIASDEKEKLEYRLVALQLVGASEELDAEEGLLDLLTELNPQIRIAAARALWRLESDSSHRAKAVLREFLSSTNADLRAQGALALAEIGDAETPGVLDELRRLRREPGSRGQLARALYKKLQLQRTIQKYEARKERGGSASSARWRHLDELREILRRYYDRDGEVEDRDLRIGAARGMVDFPDDPHTVFLSPEQYQEFLHGADGVDPSYGGIGAFIDTNVKDRLRILRPIFGGPAWNGDIQGGDEIVAVDGKTTAGRSITEIIKQVKGPPGTAVTLRIVRNGWTKPRDIRVIRARIVLPSVYSRMLPGKIGYVVIAQFAYETGAELKKTLLDLEQQGMRGLVIDVRDNPGGLLGSVVGCLSNFLNEGDLITTVRGRVIRPERHMAEKPNKQRRYPVSVLINRRSASGAELMSGVMQHYSKASKLSSHDGAYLDVVLLGESSFGKGTVQHTLPLRTWPGEQFVDVARKNGLYDRGEPYVDKNKNGRWDPGEPHTDIARKNSRWNKAEDWVDKNGNGKWDEGEDFTDGNKDGVWNPAETFQDKNGNNTYDNGAAVKLTVARYYLPDGSNFTRKRVETDGVVKFVGGVEPDIASANPDLKLWELIEMRELQNKGVFADYVKKYWPENKAKLRELAYYDARNDSAYPSFDDFYASLETQLSRQIIRRVLRLEVRREVAKELGREIVGDLSDDYVLRHSVRNLLTRLGEDPESMPEYRTLNGNDTEKKKTDTAEKTDDADPK
jgi:C-terminal peptidase prc